MFDSQLGDHCDLRESGVLAWEQEDVRGLPDREHAMPVADEGERVQRAAEESGEQGGDRRADPAVPGQQRLERAEEDHGRRDRAAAPGGERAGFEGSEAGLREVPPDPGRGAEGTQDRAEQAVLHGLHQHAPGWVLYIEHTISSNIRYCIL